MTGTSFAIVRPRVISELTGETLLLEDVVASHLAAGDEGVIAIMGGPLSGKTTAIEYLNRVLADERRLVLSDEHARLLGRSITRRGVTVWTPSSERSFYSIARYRLAPWGRDEWIEYLLAAHKDRCSSVIRRLGAREDTSFLNGNPCLWQMVLDELAANDAIPSATESLRRKVDQLFSSTDLRVAVRDFALVAAAPLQDELDGEARVLAKFSIERPVLRLLALEPVRSIFAVEAIVADLHAGVELSCLRRQLPYSLLREASLVVKTDESLQRKLQELLLDRDMSVQPMAASLLHAAGVGWKPERQTASVISKVISKLPKLPELSQAYLVDANWPEIDLRGAQLYRAKMTGSNLENAKLDGANLIGANLSGAKLHGASLEKLRAHRAVFTSADFTFARAAKADLAKSDCHGADLEGALLTEASFIGARLAHARFVRANLADARLLEADLEDADFTQANLERAWLARLDLRVACFDHAIFAAARLVDCNLEGMELPGANFKCADLQRALMTSSIMSNASFFNADLRAAGLADVEWEGVDLRGADLRESSFHLGSTRSGLVGSPYPSHGTRTGFYTDDYGDQDFKAPEEIRKANLRGADLRGANIEGVNFYLVDVRDARYDEQQEAHLRQCGAILETRAF